MITGVSSLKLGFVLRVIAALFMWSMTASARDGKVVLQFDDSDSTQFNPGFSTIQAHGLTASYGLITGEINIRPGAMTDAMVITLRDYGCSFQDHTWSHWAAFWGNPAYAAQWPVHIAQSQAVFDRLGIPMRSWNQPGGTGEGFTPQLRDTLVAHGYEYAAGRVGLAYQQWFNFHYGFLDDPFSLGRGVYSWGYNAPAAALEAMGLDPFSEQGRRLLSAIDPWMRGDDNRMQSMLVDMSTEDGNLLQELLRAWTWQAEVAAIETKIADGVAQGRFPTPVFHEILPDAAAGLDAICDWLGTQDIDVVTMDEAVALTQADNSIAYGMNLAPSLAVDRDGNSRPDGWLGVSMGGYAENGFETTIYGTPAGKLLVSAELIAPDTDDFTVLYEKTTIRLYAGPTYAYSTGPEYRTHTTIAGQPIVFADTVNVGEGTDRIRIQVYGFENTPVQLLSIEAVPLQEPFTGIADLPPRIDLAFHVWPNPSSRIVYIETDRPSIVDIFDVLGRRLGSVTTPRTRNIELRSSGVYFLRATSGSATATARVVITR
jgi:hypothetical protein